jgi:hypothetical protein
MIAFGNKTDIAEVASERISGPPRWVRDVGLTRETTKRPINILPKSHSVQSGLE